LFRETRPEQPYLAAIHSSHYQYNIYIKTKHNPILTDATMWQHILMWYIMVCLSSASDQS